MFDYNKLVEVEDLTIKMMVTHPDWRFGQCYFNALWKILPDEANEIRGTKLDCFHRGKAEVEKLKNHLWEKINGK